MFKRLVAVLALALVGCFGAAAQCVLTFNPVSANPSASGGDAAFNVTASTSNCPRTAVSNNLDWITISFGQTGNGLNSSVGYTVKPNTLSQSRTGSITVNTQQFQITQAGAICSYTLTPATQSVGSGGGTYTLKVDTACTWSPTSTVSWVSITSGPTTTGPGSVNYSIAPNTGTTTRTGAIQIGTQQLTITQFATVCAYSISPTAVGFPASGGTGQIAVQTDATCSWTVANPIPWITNVVINTAANGAVVGPGTVSYTVAANTSPTVRSGVWTIAGQSATVTQNGAGIIFTAGSVVNAASFATGPVAPGEIITIFGTGLGPAPGVGLQLTTDGQSLTSSIGGTRVLFDGLAAPMIYASDTQVSAIVPYSLTGAVTTQLAIEVQGTRSATVAVSVKSASPAIFTIPSAGTGQGAVLNQDYTVNGVNHPAAPGTVLQIFATGEGQTLPGGTDGKLAGSSAPAPLLQPVTAQIGGLPAQVLYAGGAPGLVAGVLQVNVVIPVGAPSGNAPLVLNIGGAAQTPSGVTVAIQ